MKLTVLLFTLGLCLPAVAATDSNNNAWFMHFVDHPIKKSRWGLHLEGQWRRTDVGLKWLRAASRWPSLRTQPYPADRDLQQNAL